MALGPGIIFVIVLNGGALLLGLLTYWYWRNMTSAKHVQQEDPVEIWCEEAKSLTQEVQQVAETADRSRDREQLRRRLLPLSNRIQGHVRIAPSGVDERVLRELYDLGVDCYRVAMEHTTLKAARTGVFIEDQIAEVRSNAEDVEAALTKQTTDLGTSS